MALVAFENGSNRMGMETKLRSFVQQAIAKSSDPFLMLVDRENQALILQEHQLALSGVLDGSTSVQVGSMMGAKAILKGTVVSCDVNTSRLQKFDQAGFESYRVERVNEDGKKVYDTKYRSVSVPRVYTQSISKFDNSNSTNFIGNGQNRNVRNPDPKSSRRSRLCAIQRQCQVLISRHIQRNGKSFRSLSPHAKDAKPDGTQFRIQDGG